MGSASTMMNDLAASDLLYLMDKICCLPKPHQRRCSARHGGTTTAPASVAAAFPEVQRQKLKGTGDAETILFLSIHHLALTIGIGTKISWQAAFNAGKGR